MRDTRRHRGLVGSAALAAASLAFATGPALPAGAGRRPDDSARDEGGRAELGRRLFFDPVVSRSGRRSCASCHDPARAFSVPERSSEDEMGPTRRRSASLVDVHRAPLVHADGEFASVEALVETRIGFVRPVLRSSYAEPTFSSAVLPPDVPPDASGLPDLNDDDRPFGTHPLDLNRLPDVATTVDDAGRYAEAFRLAFGSPSATRERIASAIAAFTRTIRSTVAPVDRFLAGDETALDASARRGLALFRGRAGCVQCHRMERERATFTDLEFHDTGVAWRTYQARVPEGKRPRDPDRATEADLGRAILTTVASDRRAFRTPTLRDVARRGPFMHDGSLETLHDVVRHYARGGSRDDERQDPRIRPFAATDEDAADLVAFLHALTSERRPGRAPVAWGARAERQRVRLVDARGRPLAEWSVALVPEGDALPASDAGGTGRLVVTTDAQGTFETPPSGRTHWRMELPDGLEPLAGPLLPDTCATATVVVPVAGRASVVVQIARGIPAPRWLDAVHEAAMRLPTDPPVRTLLTHAGRVAAGDEQRVLYEGWVRTDVPAEVSVVLPGEAGVGRAARLDPDRPAVLTSAAKRPLRPMATVGQVRRLDPRAAPRVDEPSHVPLLPRRADDGRSR